ncbi:MAG: hypothetical protein ABH824_07310 [Nanoarchaeota archaeon]
MKFKVEIYIGSGQERYRLQKDDTWRRVGSALTRNYPSFDRKDDYHSNNRLFDNLHETKPYLSIQGKMELGGKEYEVDPIEKSLSTFFNSVHIKPKVHRITKPNDFYTAELEKIIANGDDNQDNALILDLNGNFKLINRSLIDESTPIAVRYETFCAGNGYVGLEASADHNFINDTYLSMLEGWIIHLMTDDLGIFQDGRYGNKSESELRQELKHLTEHLV